MIDVKPAEGELVDTGSGVTLYVSTGKVAVPNVVGDTEAQARATLIQYGFTPQVIPQEDATATPGILLNSISAETTNAASATPAEGLQVMIGGKENGIKATVMHGVSIIDPSDGSIVTGLAPEQPNEGELLLGTFTITYQPLPNRTVTQTLSVLRAAP